MAYISRRHGVHGGAAVRLSAGNTDQAAGRVPFPLRGTAARVSPVTEDERRSKNRIYRIADEFLAFYLGPLSRYQPEIERGLGDSIADALLDRLDDYMGRSYEDAFRHHLRRLANTGALGPKVVAIGPWWTRDGNDEIDAIVLAERDEKRVPVLVGECKWGRRVDAGRIKATLIRKAASLTDESDLLRYCVCARDELINADADPLTVTAATFVVSSSYIAPPFFPGRRISTVVAAGHQASLACGSSGVPVFTAASRPHTRS